MKKAILLPAVIAFIITSLQAQQPLTVDPYSHQLQFPASGFSDGHSLIYNNSGVDRLVKWIRYTDVEPAGWYTLVCDDITCYTQTVSVAPNAVLIQAGETGLLKLNVYPNDIPGTGSYRLLVYDVNDSANANATMIVDVVAEEETGISNVKDELISIQPIPVKDVMYMNLDADKHITSVEMFNVVGQKFKTVPLKDGIKSVAIPVSELKKGVYFLRVLSSGKELTTITFSKD